MERAPRWRTTDAARAADVSYRQLSTLLDRGIFCLKGDDVGTPGAGVSREFTRESIYRLALTVGLMRAGIHCRLAARLADDFSAIGAADEHPTHLVADLGNGGRIITASDTASIALAVDLGPVLTPVNDRLSEMEPIR